MAITEISIITDFEAGMSCLQNPSFLSGSFSLLGIESYAQFYSFCKWSALVLALVATLTAVINRTKLLVRRLISKSLLSTSSEPLLQQLSHDYESSEDDACSSVSSEDNQYESTPPPLKDHRTSGDDFSVAGSSIYYHDGNWGYSNLCLRRCRSAGNGLDFAVGQSVVKLWNDLGLGIEADDSFYTGEFQVWESNKYEKVSYFFGRRCQIPAISLSSPEVVLSTEVDNRNNVVLGVNDTRVGRRIPAMYAEWRQREGKVVGIKCGGVQKVHVREDDGGALTVVDLRNVKSPLKKLTVTDWEWDADAVILTEDMTP